MDEKRDDGANAPLIEMARADVASAVDYDVSQLAGVDWRIEAGEFWIIGGGRNVGKTDLIATAAAMQKPREGSVKLFGREISELSETETQEQRRRVGFVFKNGGRMLGRLTVIENILLPLLYHHGETARKDELPEKILDALGLGPFAHNTVGMLTAPWQQRVCLARALALQPQVLFLDEPIFGLDARERNWWLDFLGQLFSSANWLQRPQTIVVTTTDWKPWLGLGQQFALVKKNVWRVLGGKAELESSAANLSDELVDA